MSKLHDPDQPPGVIVATHEDDETLEEGQVRRNDGVVLNPASKNPWYVLATVAGEQGYSIRGRDGDLHAKNRRFWNGWMCQNMSEEDRPALAEKLELDPDELQPLTDDERRKLEKRYANAFPDVAMEDRLPDPNGLIDMSGVHFPSALALGKCHFARPAYFGTAHFAGPAYFGTAHFAGAAHFEAAHFAGFADFRVASFRGAAFFERSQFDSPADFIRASFAEITDFSDGFFKARTSFANAKFEKQSPKFFHRGVHQNTSFTDEIESWPSLNQVHAEEGKRAYTRLRQIAAEIYDPDLEHFFLRQEMRCKEMIERKKGAWFYVWAHKLYRWVSDCGYGVGQPLALLAFVWAFGLSCFAGHFDSGVLPYLPEEVQDSRYLAAAGVSFGNVFGFLGLNRLYFTELLRDHSPEGLQFVSGAQTVAGVILLFFLGLGLRNRFRLK